MTYTIRVTLRVRGTQRIIREFLRPEYAGNTSSHATRFETVQAADDAADIASDNWRAAGHTVIGTDIYHD